jgi:hypothetical protein
MVALIAILLPAHGGFGPSVIIGWPNRLLMLAYYTWVLLVGWKAVAVVNAK